MAFTVLHLRVQLEWGAEVWEAVANRVSSHLKLEDSRCCLVLGTDDLRREAEVALSALAARLSQGVDSDTDIADPPQSTHYALARLLGSLAALGESLLGQPVASCAIPLGLEEALLVLKKRLSIFGSGAEVRRLCKIVVLKRGEGVIPVSEAVPR